MFRTADIEHYYAKFFSCRQRNPERMYLRLRFDIFDRVSSTIFQPEVPGDFHIVCAHKRLNGAALAPPAVHRRPL